MSRRAIPLAAIIIAVCGCALFAALHGGAGTNDKKVEPTSAPAIPPSDAAPVTTVQVALHTPAPVEVAEKPATEPAPAPVEAAEKPAAAPAGGPMRDITFDDIKFDMQKEDPFERKMLTPKIEKLDGTRIRIRGYIKPSFQESGITQFILVRDNQECCFGPGAYLFDCIFVEMQPGLSTDYTLRPVAVEGTFSVKEVIGPGKKHLAIYHLSGEKVK